MQLASRASLAFKFKKTAMKPTFGANVINAISTLVLDMKAGKTNSPNFPVPLNDLRSINNELYEALQAAGKNSEALLRTAILQWDAAFTLTANFISDMAKGNEDFIRNAGFVPTKKERQNVLVHSMKRNMTQISTCA